VKFAQPLHLILISLSASFARVCWVLLLMGVFLYAFSLVFTQILGRDMMDALPGDDPALATLRHRFSTVARTFFELFRAMCGDVTDFGVLVSASSNNLVAPLAYMSFQVTTPWLILAIFTAEVVDSTMTTSRNYDRENAALEAMHSRTRQKDKLSSELFELFADINAGADGNSLELDALATFLEEECNELRLKELAGLTVFQCISAYEAIENDGIANMEDYVDSLVLSSRQSIEHSLLRMEAQIRGMLRNQEAVFHLLGLPEAHPNHPNKRLVAPQGEPAVAASANGLAVRSLDIKVDTKSHPSGIHNILTEMSDLRTEINVGFGQLQSTVQAVQLDQTGLRRSMSAVKEADHKAVGEVRKIQRELGESNSQIHGALLGISDVRNDISALCKQQANANRSPQLLDELRGEVHQLRNEMTHLARAEDMGHLVEVMAAEDRRVDFTEITAAIRGDFASLTTFIRGDLASVRGDLAEVSEVRAGFSNLQGSVESLQGGLIALRGGVETLLSLQGGVEMLLVEIGGVPVLRENVEALRAEIAALVQSLRVEGPSSAATPSSTEASPPRPDFVYETSSTAADATLEARRRTADPQSSLSSTLSRSDRFASSGNRDSDRLWATTPVRERGSLPSESGTVSDRLYSKNNDNSSTDSPLLERMRRERRNFSSAGRY